MHTEETKNYSFSDKWTTEIEQYNFTQIPNLLLNCQGHLELKDGELITLIQLMTFWFSRKSKVWPSITTLTKFSNNGYSTIQKRLKSLEEKGFIKRIHRMNTSNTYDLSGCIKILNKHQKVCLSPPRSRSAVMLNVRRDPSYQFTKEQYETRRISNFNQTMNNVTSTFDEGFDLND